MGHGRWHSGWCSGAAGQTSIQPANGNGDYNRRHIHSRPKSAANIHPAAGPASFLFDPPTIQAAKGNTFAVNLLISGAQNVYSVPVQLNYDPKMLQLVNVSNGGFLSQDGQAVALVHREDETLGQSQITAQRPPGAGGVSGQGRWSRMTFMAKARWPDSIDDYSRRSARSRPAGDNRERGAGLGDNAVRSALR